MLVTNDDAQAIFLINTTSDLAPLVVNDLINSTTTSRFGQQLGAAGDFLCHVPCAFAHFGSSVPLILSNVSLICFDSFN